MRNILRDILYQPEVSCRHQELSCVGDYLAKVLRNSDNTTYRFGRLNFVALVKPAVVIKRSLIAAPSTPMKRAAAKFRQARIVSDYYKASSPVAGRIVMSVAQCLSIYKGRM